MVFGLESLSITRLWFRVHFEAITIQSLLIKDGIIASRRNQKSIETPT